MAKALRRIKSQRCNWELVTSNSLPSLPAFSNFPPVNQYLVLLGTPHRPIDTTDCSHDPNHRKQNGTQRQSHMIALDSRF